MESWKSYLYSIIVCAFLCSILLQILSDGKKKAMVRLISGTVLAIALLQPLSGIRPEDLIHVPVQNRYDADAYITQGQQLARDTRESIIEELCEAYILDKAKALGGSITVEFSLDQNGSPVFAHICGDAAPDVQLALQEILTTDLGIPKENQQWIWNQESSGSPTS